MTYEEVLERLRALSYPAGLERCRTICNTKCKLFCVKSADMVKLAKQLTPYREQIIYDFPDNDYYEIDILKAYMVTQVKCSLQQRLTYFKRLAPHIENWSVCDSLGKRFFLKSEQQPILLDFSKQLIATRQCFPQRLGLDLIMSQLISPQYLDEIFTILDNIEYGEYYLDMGAAWLIAEMYGKHNTETVEYLSSPNGLSRFVHNKALQKARESFRVTPLQKQLAAELKRK